MIYKYSSPPQKVTIKSPRKVTHVHTKSPQPLKNQTQITSTKKIVIESNYDPLFSSYDRPMTHITKSAYIPEEEIVKINQQNSKFKSPNSKILISQNQISNKENDQNFSLKKQIGSNSNIYQVNSGLRKYQVPNLFTTKHDIYEGEHNKNGFFDGKGKYYFRGCSVVYEGEFCDGQIYGLGKLYLQKTVDSQFPIIYEGKFKHAKKDGKGTYYYGDKNHFYRGQWVKDIKQGHGYYESPQQTYEGYWAKNKKHGKGNLINKRNNTQFHGKFYDDYFTEGEIRYSNGDVYVGSFHLGKKEGYGTYSYKVRNQEYQGEFSNDLRHGKGTLKMSNGDQFRGSFRHGRIDQSMNCQYRWANGSVFNGWFKNSQPDKGTIKNLKEDVQYEYTSTAQFVQQ